MRIEKKQINVYDDHPKSVSNKIAENENEGWRFKRKVYKYSGLWKMKYYKVFFERQLSE